MGAEFQTENNMQVCMEAANSEKIKPRPHPEGHASNLKSLHREQVSEVLREWGAPGPGLHRDVHAAGKRLGRQGQGEDTEYPPYPPAGWGGRGGRRRLASCSATKGELGAGSGASLAW